MHIFEQIANENHITVEEVRREIEAAIRAGFENPNPKIQAKWARIPRKGEIPTPEEFILYVVRQTIKDNASV